MSFSKPYPPDPITYQEYDAIVDALETRGGGGFSGYWKDRTQIINSRGNLWDFEPGNVQKAIDDLLDNSEGGAVWLPKGKVVETDQWLIDTAYPIHIFGAGMCWHGLDRGTMIEFQLANGKNCIEFYESGQTGHYGGLYDFTIYPTSGDQDVIYINSWSDFHIERIYINQAKKHGINIESESDAWNIWVKDCLIENCVNDGIRLDGGLGAGVVLKSYFLNNYFYSNNIDVEAGNLGGDDGQVRLCQFHNNQHFNTDTIGMKLYKKVESFLIMGAIFYACGGDAIDISDDGPANKCTRINIGPVIIDGNGATPNGIDIQGNTDRVVIDNFQIFDFTNAAINQGGSVTNIKIGDGHQA